MTSTRKTFDQELKELKQDLLKMGGAVDQMMSGAMKALKECDVDLADKVIAMDDIVDNYNLEIEQKCLKLLALQQPMAVDLRTIAATLYIIKDVERMGDYALDIAKAAKKLADKPFDKLLEDLPRMAELVRKMLRDSLDAYINHDIKVIEEVARDDDEVDRLYRLIRDELLEYMEKYPTLIRQAMELILIVRYLERIADHITNVGERVYYMEIGEIKELH